ncbi:MAG: TolC family protein [Thermodesulfobacteriota bacterium]|nr:TolC family protein [Thermodesulfobacteriota bacterium]
MIYLIYLPINLIDIAIKAQPVRRLSILIIFCIIKFLIPVMICEAGGNNEKNGLLTLKESIYEALNKNPLIKARQEAVKGSVNAKNQARTDLLPTFRSSYNYTGFDRAKNLKNVPLGPSTNVPYLEIGEKDNYQWDVGLYQPVFTGFAIISKYRLAGLGVNLSNLELNLSELDLILGVKEAYYGVLKAIKDLDVAKKAFENLQSQVNDARNFYDVGLIPVNDLLKTEVEFANVRHNLVKAQNNIRLARSAFNIILTRSINEPVNIEDTLIYEPISLDYDNYVQLAVENRPELKTVDTRILKVDQEIRLARSKYYPELSLAVNYIKEGDGPEVSGSNFHESTNWRAMGVLSWTFWQWGKTHYSVCEKKNLKRELIQIRKWLEDSIRLEVKEAILELVEAEENIPTTKKAVEQSEENFRVNRDRYKAQLTTSTEVLDAQTLMTQASSNYYNALYEFKVGKARLDRAVGIHHKK